MKYLISLSDFNHSFPSKFSSCLIMTQDIIRGMLQTEKVKVVNTEKCQPENKILTPTLSNQDFLLQLFSFFHSLVPPYTPVPSLHSLFSPSTFPSRTSYRMPSLQSLAPHDFVCKLFSCITLRNKCVFHQSSRNHVFKNIFKKNFISHSWSSVNI